MGSIMHHQSRHVFPASSHPVIPNVADTTENDRVISQDHHNNIENTQPVHGFQLPPFMSNSDEVDNTGMFSSNLRSTSDQANPFIPPPLPVNILKKIEKNEYVSFEDLRPSTPSASTPREEHFIDISVETSASRLRQKEKNKKINSWLIAWNNRSISNYFVIRRLFVGWSPNIDSTHVTGTTKILGCWWYLKAR